MQQLVFSRKAIQNQTCSEVGKCHNTRIVTKRNHTTYARLRHYTKSRQRMPIGTICVSEGDISIV